MDEIKVGQYVRLARCQGINKIIDIDEDGFLILDDNIADEYGDECCQISPQDADEEIVNHSFNIIDLIEIGDIVEVVTEKDFEGEYTNKLEVAAVGITDFKGNKLNEIGICGDDEIEYVSLKDIRTILTHEQYERDCYKIN